MGLENKRAFLFDIDGTLSVGSHMLEGSLELIQFLEKNARHVFYITNNSSKSRQDYVSQFMSWWGIETRQEQFVTASYVTTLFLNRHHRDDKIFVMGTSSFVKELKKNGFHVTEVYESDVDVVLVGFDQELRYEKLVDACRLLMDQTIPFYGTDPDLNCPAPFGAIPDCGSICQMITNAIHREPIFLGKPNPMIVELCQKEANVAKDEILVVGDRLYTDIAVGIEAGVDTAVVFTGEAKPEDLEHTKYPPTYAFKSTKELLGRLQEEQGWE